MNIFEESLYDINDEINTIASIKKIIDIDNGELFYTTLTLSELSLLQPIDIEETIQKIVMETCLNKALAW